MEIQELEKAVKLIKCLDGMSNNTGGNLPFEVGRSYFIRTVTYHLLGRVKSLVGRFIILEQASFVADSGRFSLAIRLCINGVTCKRCLAPV